MNMKRALIIALVCLDLALLAALVAGKIPSKAHAQGIVGTDYMMVTGRESSNKDAVFILDRARDRLMALKLDRKRLRPVRGRNLKTDFATR